MGKPPTWEKLKQELSCQKDYFILEQLIEDAEDKFEILMKYQAVLEIRQANHQDRLAVIRKWAEILDKHERTLSRLLQKVEKEGLAALAPRKRSDAGKLMGSNRWKKNREEEWSSREEAVIYWRELIIKIYKNGNQASRRISPHQVFIQLKSRAELDLGLKEGEYPSHVFVYKVLEPLAKTGTKLDRLFTSKGCNPLVKGDKSPHINTKVL